MCERQFDTDSCLLLSTVPVILNIAGNMLTEACEWNYKGMCREDALVWKSTYSSKKHPCVVHDTGMHTSYYRFTSTQNRSPVTLPASVSA